MSKPSLLAAASAFVIGLASPVLAQEASQPQAEADAPEGIADIVVTAQRREESLQRAAVAVTAVSGDSLVNFGVTGAADIQKLVPALKISPTGGTSSLFLRGVGTNSQNSFSENAVAFNFNGVYIARPSALAGVFYDLDRVEVVKGPQGTLYGRNATGGALNVVPRKPQLNEFGGSFMGEVSNYNGRNFNAALNVPLGSVTALRVAGQVIKHDGYLSDGYDDEDGKALRASLLFKPSSDFSVLLVGDYFDQGGKGAGSVLLPNSAFSVPALEDRVGIADKRATDAISAYAATRPAPPFCGGAGRLVTSGCVDLPQTDGYLDNQIYGISGTLEANLGFATLTVQPAYRKSNVDYRTWLPGFKGEIQENAEQFSLETRITSNGSGPLSYVLGAFYFSEDLVSSNFFRQGDLSTTRFTPNVKTKSYAGFGQLTYALSDTVRAVLGGRYTKESKDQLTASVSGGRPLAVNPPLGAPFAGSLDFSKFTWKAGLEWNPRAASLVYANVSTGFKSGGFFVAAPPSNTFAPEKLTAYTIGTKNRFFGNKLQLNLEAFYWDYKDQQITFVGGVLTGNGIFAQGSRTENAGKSRMYGLELESMWQPTANDRFNLNVQYLNGKYNSLQTANFSGTGAPVATGCTVLGSRLANPTVPGNTARFFDLDCSGKPAVNAPRWSINAGFEHAFPLSDTTRLLVGARTTIESSRFLNANFRPEERQGSYMMSDAYITGEFANGAVNATLFVNNLEDKEVIQRAGTRPVLDFPVGKLAPPRVWGVRVGYRF